MDPNDLDIIYKKPVEDSRVQKIILDMVKSYPGRLGTIHITKMASKRHSPFQNFYKLHPEAIEIGDEAIGLKQALNVLRSLEEAGMFEKYDDNTYALSEKGKVVQALQI